MIFYLSFITLILFIISTVVSITQVSNDKRGKAIVMAVLNISLLSFITYLLYCFLIVEQIPEWMIENQIIIFYGSLTIFVISIIAFASLTSKSRGKSGFDPVLQKDGKVDDGTKSRTNVISILLNIIFLTAFLYLILNILNLPSMNDVKPSWINVVMNIEDNDVIINTDGNVLVADATIVQPCDQKSKPVPYIPDSKKGPIVVDPEWERTWPDERGNVDALKQLVPKMYGAEVKDRFRSGDGHNDVTYQQTGPSPILKDYPELKEGGTWTDGTNIVRQAGLGKDDAFQNNVSSGMKHDVVRSGLARSQMGRSREGVVERETTEQYSHQARTGAGGYNSGYSAKAGVQAPQLYPGLQTASEEEQSETYKDFEGARLNESRSKAALGTMLSLEQSMPTMNSEWLRQRNETMKYEEDTALAYGIDPVAEKAKSAAELVRDSWANNVYAKVPKEIGLKLIEKGLAFADSKDDNYSPACAPDVNPFV